MNDTKMLMMKMISKSIVLKLFFRCKYLLKNTTYFSYINSSSKHLFFEINMVLIIYLISN